MLELPEVTTIARQMDGELRGKTIEAVICGASPHKFAFFNRPAGEFVETLPDSAVSGVSCSGTHIMTDVESDRTLLLSEMGGRILFERNDSRIPPKHQLLLRFAGGGALTVRISLWGFIGLMPRSDVPAHLNKYKRSLPPLSDEFTFDYFQSLLADPEEREKKSAKYFMISKPGIAGVGNGCLQDILFHAKIHPKRRIADRSPQEQQALYDSTRRTLARMIEQGGRDLEHDLYDRPGGYKTILGSHSAGRPCPVCGATIQKIAYLGGAAYFCPNCQR